MANCLVLTRSTRTSPLRGAVNGPGAVCAAQLHPSGVTRGHERPTMDRRLSAVLTHVLAGRTRHRKRRSYGATLTRAAKRPRVAAAVGASTRLVAQAFFPAIQQRPAGPRHPAANLSITHDRGLAGGCAAESPPADPTLGGSRSAERGCTGRAGRCSRPRRRFGCRRRRAPSVRRRRRGVCHCASAQPCLDCSPTQAGQTLLGPAGACAWSAAGLGWHRPGQPRSAAGRGVQGLREPRA